MKVYVAVRTQVCSHCAMHAKKVTMINQRLIMQCRIVYIIARQ